MIRFTTPVNDETILLEEASDVSYVLVDVSSSSLALFAANSSVRLLQLQILLPPVKAKDAASKGKHAMTNAHGYNAGDLMAGEYQLCVLVQRSVEERWKNEVALHTVALAHTSG